MLKELWPLALRQITIIPTTTITIQSATITSVFTTTFNGAVTVTGYDGSGCGGCYIVAEVANVIVGTSLISGTTTTIQIPIGSTSFTFGGNLTITLAPTPIIIYELSDTFALSGETLYSDPLIV